jgi:hypothetical protein
MQDNFKWITAVISITTLFAASSPQPILRQRTKSFTIALNGPVPKVTPLFGPIREAEWAPGWRPHFLHPLEGKQIEGAVFTTRSANGRERLWLLTDYNVDQGRVDYAVITPGFTANEIQIRVVDDGEQRSRATITYRHSALAPEGNDEVAKLDEHWADEQRAHWESAINALLAKERS